MKIIFLLFKFIYSKNYDNPLKYQESERLPINIELDFSFLDEKNDPYSCYRVGDIIKNIYDNNNYTCNENDILNSLEISILKQMIINCKIYLESFIKINKPNKRIQLIDFLDEHIKPKKKESEADLFLTITLRHFPFENIFSLGKAINYSPIDSRPNQGILYIELSGITSIFKDQSHFLNIKRFEYSFMKSIISILGFSQNCFKKWLNRETGKPWEENFPLKIFKNPLYPNMEFPILFTPQLHKYAKNRWDIEEFTPGIPNGVELYFDYKLSSYGCYLNGRVFHNDLLSNSIMDNPIISEVTLLVLEDMGWYSTNFSFAKTLTWGAGELLPKEKKKYFNNSPPQLSFPDNYEFEIVEDRMTYTTCSHDFSEMKLAGNMFNELVNCTIGSFYYDSNFCMNQAFYNPLSKKYRGSLESDFYMLKGISSTKLLCNYEMKRDDYEFKKYNMYFGKESYCFRTLGDYNNLSDLYSTSACYKAKCLNNNKVMIFYGESIFECNSTNSFIQINSNFSILCPSDLSLFCKTIEYSKKILNEPLRIKLPGDISNYSFLFYFLIIFFLILIIFLNIYYYIKTKNKNYLQI